MLAEIKALAPEGIFLTDFTIVKREAREFWAKFFAGRYACVIVAGVVMSPLWLG